jgi:hypothetical protein
MIYFWFFRYVFMRVILVLKARLKVVSKYLRGVKLLNRFPMWVVV